MLDWIVRRVVVLARMVKIEHSIFALPFAYLGAFVAARGWPGWRVFLVLSVAMVSVRSYAMAFNRLLDLPYDRENPRTQQRELVIGTVRQTEAWLFMAANAAVFVLACWALNRLCLLLAFPVLLLAGIYSYTKRFTWLCHFLLGLVLGLSPLAGWLAVRPELTGTLMPVMLFMAGVIFWVAGFDMLYACQDMEFDRSRCFYSLPAVLGASTALALSSFCHVNASLFFCFGGWAAGLGWPYYTAWGVVSLVLLCEHLLISANDLSRMNLAFFTLNGIVSILLFGGVAWGLQV
ncbi:4-hydroxybenzoate polyprenyltransferase [Desulfovibrionales bacterium]